MQTTHSKKTPESVYANDHIFEKSVRLVGRVVHKSIRHVVLRVYWWNKIADCR